MIILSTDDLDESIRFYSETLGMPLKFRDGTHFAALDGGAVTLALATAGGPSHPGQVVVGIKTADVDAAAKAIEASGGGIVKGPYDDAHERRAVVFDNKGNGLVFYSPAGALGPGRHDYPPLPGELDRQFCRCRVRWCCHVSGCGFWRRPPRMSPWVLKNV